jgi:spoIIIJ-associated protein
MALGVSADEIEIEVLDEGAKGLFGLGQKMARVRAVFQGLTGQEGEPAISGRPSGAMAVAECDGAGRDRAFQFLEALFAKIDVKAAIDVRQDEGALSFVVHGDQLGLLIGRRGQTLDALQYLVNLVGNKGASSPTRFVVDVEGYRERREETLRHLADRLASKVKTRRHKAVLEPMTPQERRIIHLALQEDPEVYTYSEGTEPYRRVVIALKEFREHEGSGGGTGSRFE